MVAKTRRRRVWVYAPEQARAYGAEETVHSGTVALSLGTLKRLGIVGGEQVRLELGEHVSTTLHPAKVDDIPWGATVQADPAVVERLTGRTRGSGWASVTCLGGTMAPVRLQPRPGLGDTARVSLTMRLLLGAGGEEELQFSPIASATVEEKHRHVLRRLPRWGSHRPERRWLTALGWFIRGARWIDHVLELCLRAILGAPTLALRVTQAHPGADTLDAVWVSPAVFTSLGISAGDHVFVSWGPSSCRALTVLEDPVSPGEPVSRVVRQSQLVDRMTTPLADDFPPQLVIRVPAPIRMELGMPPASVVEIRRRLQPIVARHLHQLTVPVSGLVLAGAAVPETRGWPLVIGSAVPAVFGVIALRIPRAPRGPWP